MLYVIDYTDKCLYIVGENYIRIWILGVGVIGGYFRGCIWELEERDDVGFRK